MGSVPALIRWQKAIEQAGQSDSILSYAPKLALQGNKPCALTLVI